MTARVPKIVWTRKRWNLKENPFPSEAIARLGGEDLRENGLLFDPAVAPEKYAEASDKFVLGAAFSGQKFGYLWSLGTGEFGDARGFGKSSLMQHLVEEVNNDFGRSVFLSRGLDEADAVERPMCAVLASFDMANARSLNAVFFEAARYASRFRRTETTPTLAERVRDRLIQHFGNDSIESMIEAVGQVQDNLRGRTLGPPVAEFLQLLCSEDHTELRRYVDAVTPTKRTRSGAIYLATLLIFVKAAGVSKVLLCCDQLEDFAATTTTKQKRTLEVERFRDYILEIQPMSDMLSCIVTMHPRATQVIGQLWHLADLPDYAHEREENRQRVVVLEPITDVERVKTLLGDYLRAYRTAEPPDEHPLFPFTEEAADVIFSRSNGKPRDILRKANALIESGAEENRETIDGDHAARILDSFVDDEEEDLVESTGASVVASDRWS